MWRRLAQWPGLVFALVFAWKLALLVFTTQPVPANDSFFYDGAVVNFLLNGEYTNPSLALTLPVSGNEVFSAYPPLYQFVLLGWMKLFGTSALAAMWLHLALFGNYLLALFATLRRIKVPVGFIHLAGLFLFGITFHDRPDSLIHALGMTAIYLHVRAEDIRATLEPPKRIFALWLSTTLALLGFTAGPVIGAMYLFIIFGLTCLRFRITRRIPDLLPAVAMVALPPLMVGAVVVLKPEWWAGFMEHARQTPSLSKLRVPQMVELLKVFRTAPGILAASLLAVWFWPTLKRAAVNAPQIIVSVATMTTIGALAVILACLLFLTANLVHVTSYLQPLIIACILTLMAPTARQKIVPAIFVALAIVVSIRAAGQTTWGLVCARNDGYSDAMRAIRTELTDLPQGQPVILSAAYLYEASQHKNVRPIHSDWLSPMNGAASVSFTDALAKLKPQKLLLTQFDYFRRYETILSELKTRPELADIRIVQTAKVRSPDSFPAIQKLVQHISWSPVIVSLSWKSPDDE